jgi:hypothetical protein
MHAVSAARNYQGRVNYSFAEDVIFRDVITSPRKKVATPLERETTFELPARFLERDIERARTMQ